MLLQLDHSRRHAPRPDAEVGATLAARYAQTRAVDRVSCVAVIGRGLRAAIYAGRKSGQMASRAYDMVFRNLRARRLAVQRHTAGAR